MTPLSACTPHYYFLAHVSRTLLITQTSESSLLTSARSASARVDVVYCEKWRICIWNPFLCEARVHVENDAYLWSGHILMNAWPPSTLSDSASTTYAHLMSTVHCLRWRSSLSREPIQLIRPTQHINFIELIIQDLHSLRLRLTPISLCKVKVRFVRTCVHGAATSNSQMICISNYHKTQHSRMCSLRFLSFF